MFSALIRDTSFYSELVNTEIHGLSWCCEQLTAELELNETLTVRVLLLRSANVVVEGVERI